MGLFDLGVFLNGGVCCDGVHVAEPGRLEVDFPVKHTLAEHATVFLAGRRKGVWG